MVSNKRVVSKQKMVDNVVLEGVVNSIPSISNTWMTMTELSKVLNKITVKNSRENLPGSPSALRVVLNRITNRLRSRGIAVRFIRASGGISNGQRTRYCSFVTNS